MAGMMIFFVFFMGAHGAQSILREDEDGTLQRLFTTPTAKATILGGKLVSVILALLVQIAVLLFVSSLIFDINWGDPATLLLAASGLIAAAAGFGVLLISFIDNTRQTGPVLGGVLPLMGMLGGLFTTGIPDLPAAFDTVMLITPQGWALRSWELALAGAAPHALMLPALVLFLSGLACFGAGVYRFSKRFA
jgi:ABC-2 type transport system permease protein